MKTTRLLLLTLVSSLALTGADGGRAQTVAKAPPLTPGQERVLAKMKQIVLPEVSFDGLPLNEVMMVMSKDASKHDPEKQGVNFRFNLVLKEDKDYLTTTIIKVGSWPVTLKNLRLLDVLDAITKSADKPIQFTIEDNGVVFSRRKLGTPLPDWSTGAETVRAKLDKIVFPQVSFDGLPLNEVIRIISDDAKRFDKEKLGLNFLGTSYYPDAPPDTNPRAVLDAKGNPLKAPDGEPFPGPRIDLDTVIVLVPPIKNAKLAQVLDLVTTLADKPLQYRIEDYGVVIMQKFGAGKPPPSPARK